MPVMLGGKCPLLIEREAGHRKHAKGSQVPHCREGRGLQKLAWQQGQPAEGEWS